MKSKVEGVLLPLKKIRGGVEADHQKKAADVPMRRMPVPEFVRIPMQQSIGAPCEPVVKVGDYVYEGTKIGEGKGPVSAPVHSSVSGTVTEIGDVKLSNGNICTGITIKCDKKRAEDPDKRPPVINSTEDFLDAVRECGLVGLGGAGFPTHAKLRSALKSEPHVDTLIVNAAECEPYISVDCRECMEYPQNIYKGIKALLKWMDFKQVIIGVEDNKPKSFETLRKIAESDDDTDDRIRLMSLRSRYPQGAEKMMIWVTTGRVVPIGKLPSDVGCVVMNVETCSVIGRYLSSGRPMISRSLTVDGDAINGPFNVRVPIGTRIQDVIDACGGYSRPPKKIILGGPMMGPALVSTEAPICKQNNAIIVLGESGYEKNPEWACIHCGKCVSACPMHLVPLKLAEKAKIKDVAGLKDLQIMACMECGSCAFVCPSHRPLVQFIRMGKALVREEGKNDKC
ncbi:MAG: electron transport complex subunit RsxC [Lachnospiraceae bacterium]|nr:electron transport complex subunit RsxC [Lachnospiraceae bacterium]